MRPMFVMLVVLTMAAPSTALAQKCDPSDESQMGMTICANADYEAADAKLNEAYGKVVEALSDDPDGKKLLQTAQRVWIAFRDAECEFVNVDSKNGSIYPMLMSECLTELTEARTKQLSVNLDCGEGEVSCPAPAEQ